MHQQAYVFDKKSKTFFKIKSQPKIESISFLFYFLFFRKVLMNKF